MCGLVGIAGQLFSNEKKAFKDMLYMDMLRGEHSTGIATVNTAFDVKVVKKALPANEFLSLKQVDNAIIDATRVLMGHNRFATQGKINNVNAHPFEFDKVVGAHNGTLRRQHLLPDSKLFDVDSENIYHSMDTQGVDATIPLIDGAYALVWWDKQNNTLNMIRNNERPLYLAFTEDGKSLFWASEDWMIVVAAHRNHVKHSKIFSLPENELHTFALPRNFLDANELEAFRSPAKKSLKGHSRVSVSTTTYTRPGIVNGGKTVTNSHTNSGLNSGGGQSVLPFPRQNRSTNSDYYSTDTVMFQVQDKIVAGKTNRVALVVSGNGTTGGSTDNQRPVAVELIGVNAWVAERLKPGQMYLGEVKTVVRRDGKLTALVSGQDIDLEGEVVEDYEQKKWERTNAHDESPVGKPNETVNIGGILYTKQSFARLLNSLGSTCGFCGGDITFCDGVTRGKAYQVLYCHDCTDHVVYYSYEEKGYDE